MTMTMLVPDRCVWGQLEKKEGEASFPGSCKCFLCYLLLAHRVTCFLSIDDFEQSY